MYSLSHSLLFAAYFFKILSLSLFLPATSQLFASEFPYTYCSNGSCQVFYSSPMMSFGRVPDEVRSTCVEQNAYALTFDDGPSANWNEVFSILERHGVKATFFVIGSQLSSEESQAALRRAAELGHQISNHSYSHPDLMGLSAEDILWQVQTTENIIRQILGDDPATVLAARILRPPYGYIDQRVQNVLNAINYTTVRWNSDRWDWAMQEGQSSLVLQRLMQHLEFIKNQNTPGLNVSILDLNHDFSRSTVDALDRLITIVQNAGYRFVTVSECLGL